jgi:pimeloyl-ACP methyl ester carboxylesterase
VTLLIVSGVATLAYSAFSIYIATRLVYVPQTPLYATPASLGLQFQDVAFPSREDHVQLRGWFIPGVLANGHLTSQRTIIMVHGSRTNRADRSAGLLLLSAAFARSGFAVLAFDMRGMGESPPAPLSLGYFEQRDVLGAVDFLRAGPLPYPDLGRPRSIAGWGVSMGAATLLLAAAQEPAIRAVVSDSAYADIAPILEREVPKGGHLPSLFTPGTLLASGVLYGMDFYAVRPVDVVASIAPRPILFIHGAADTYIPPSTMQQLAIAARMGTNANVQTWLVPGATHAQAFDVLKQAYVTRVVAFFTAALGPDTGQ